MVVVRAFYVVGTEANVNGMAAADGVYCAV